MASSLAHAHRVPPTVKPPARCPDCGSTRLIRAAAVGQSNAAQGFAVSAFQIEPCNPDDEHIRWTIAASATLTAGQAAFNAATLQYSGNRLALHKGIMLMRERVPKSKVRAQCLSGAEAVHYTEADPRVG